MGIKSQNKEHYKTTKLNIPKLVNDYQWFSQNEETKDCVFECLNIKYDLDIAILKSLVARYK